MVVDPQYNRGTDCMPFPCFFLADGKGVCYTVTMFIFWAEVDQNRRSET